MTKKITEHEGQKYLREIFPADGNLVVNPGRGVISLRVDVYCVLKAFNVTCPARAHAIKKLLTAGERGKGDALADLKGAEAAVARAIELEAERTVEEDAKAVEVIIEEIAEGQESKENLAKETEKQAVLNRLQWGPLNIPKECIDPREYE